MGFLLQFHLRNSPSVSVWSPSALYSSKTVMICIWHTNLCYPSCKHQNIFVKDRFLTLAHLLGTICLKHSATLVLPPLLKPPSRHTYSVTISKLFFTAMPIPLSDTQVRACLFVCVCVVSVIIKCPLLQPCAVDRHSRNPLYYYFEEVYSA